MHTTLAKIGTEMAKQSYALCAGKVIIGPQVYQRGAYGFAPVQREAMIIHHPFNTPIALENKRLVCRVFQLGRQLFRLPDHGPIEADGGLVQHLRAPLQVSCAIGSNVRIISMRSEAEQRAEGAA